jgi:hypothetical protein
VLQELERRACSLLHSRLKKYGDTIGSRKKWKMNKRELGHKTSLTTVKQYTHTL